MLGQCWSTVYDAGPALIQHWINASCLLASASVTETCQLHMCPSCCVIRLCRYNAVIYHVYTNNISGGKFPWAVKNAVISSLVENWRLWPNVVLMLGRRHHTCLSKLFLLHLNINVMGLRPLKIFYCFREEIVCRRQILTSVGVRV